MIISHFRPLLPGIGLNARTVDRIYRLCHTVGLTGDLRPPSKFSFAPAVGLGVEPPESVTVMATSSKSVIAAAVQDPRKKIISVGRCPGSELDNGTFHVIHDQANGSILRATAR